MNRHISPNTINIPRTHKIIIFIWLIPLLAAGITLSNIGLYFLNSRVELPFSHTISTYEVVLGLAYPIIGALIIIRKPGNPIGWILCVMGLAGALGPFSIEYVGYAYTTHPAGLPLSGLMSWVNYWVFYVGLTAFVLLILMFPDGRLHSPIGRPLFSIVILSMLYIIISSWLILWEYRGADLLLLDIAHPEQYALVNIWMRPAIFIIPPSYILAVASLLLRFRKASTVQRLQLKWFLYAGMLLVVFIVLQIIIGLVFPGMNELFGVLFNFLTGLIVFAFLVAIAIAITRYRLFDIDIIIRRTLVYSTLTLILGVVYFGSVLMLQTIFRSLVGESNQFTIVISTLFIAALFNPLRKRIHELLDRRFYRKRYDTQLTIQAFAASLRNEVDLDELSNSLTSIVQETIQPQGLSLWIKKDS